MTVRVLGLDAVALAEPPAPVTTKPRRSVRSHLTAAAVRLDQIPDSKKRNLSARVWQQAAWNYYDDLSAISQAAEFAGNCHARLRFFAGYYENPGEDPTPTDDARAVESVAEMAQGLQRANLDGSALTGPTALRHGLGVNRFVAGQCYAHVYDDADAEGMVWDLLSVLEVDWAGGQWYKTRSGERVPIPRDEILIDLYRPHPARRDTPISPVWRVRSECAELVATGHAILSMINSRRSAGGFKIPSELSFASEKPEDFDGTEEDWITKGWMDYFLTPIRDHASAASVVPFLLRGPAEHLKGDAVGYIDFGRQLDEGLLERFSLTKHSLREGLDLPVEVLEGIGGTNHWTGWKVDEDLAAKHIIPDAEAYCTDLTIGYHWPRLRAAGMSAAEVRRHAIWFDDTQLVVHPDRTQDALAAHGAGVISDEALRDELNFTEDQAPTPEELERRVQTVITRDGVQRRPVPNEGPPNNGRAPEQATVTASTKAELRSMVAASTSRLDRLAADLHRIDARLFERLASAADPYVRRALERAGAQLRSTVNGNPAHMALRSSLRDVANAAVAAHIGPERVRSLGLAEDKTLAGTLDDYVTRVRAWLQRTQEETLRRIAEELDDEEAEDLLERTGPERSRYVAAAVSLLASGLVAYTRERLYDPTPSAPAKGEFDDLLAPRGLLRDVMTVAGGGDPNRVTEIGTAAGGIAQGETAMDVLRSVGIRAEMYEWHWGGAEKPFPPHLDLDGREFSDFGELETAPEDAWLGGVYRPGDHAGCSCDVSLRLAEDVPLAASATNGHGDPMAALATAMTKMAMRPQPAPVVNVEVKGEGNVRYERDEAGNITRRVVEV